MQQDAAYSSILLKFAIYQIMSKATPEYCSVQMSPNKWTPDQKYAEYIVSYSGNAMRYPTALSILFLL